MSTTFTLVRHGETKWNADGLIQGVSNIPLNEMGEKQAIIRAPFFKNEHYDLTYSSPLDRAVKTMEIIQKENGFNQDIHLDDRLVERNFGTYEGVDIQNFRDDLTRDSISPTYESDASIIHRVSKCLLEIAQNNRNKNILVTAHSHVLKAMLKYVDGEKYSFRQGLENLGVCKFTYSHDNQTWSTTYDEVTD